jgi:hypothetical protein
MRVLSTMYAIKIPNIILLLKLVSFLATKSIKVIVSTSSIKKSKSSPYSNKLENECHLSLNMIGTPLLAICEGIFNSLYKAVLS